MSVDFVVFDPSGAPREGKAFRQWFFETSEWADGELNFNPNHSSPPLQQWYQAMSERFPDLGQAREDADADERWVDYTFGRHLIQVSMTPKFANEAWSLAREKAKELGLGYYDCMSDNGKDNRTIVFPDGPLASEPSFLAKLFGKSKA